MMTYHEWGDDDFDWDGLYAAALFIGDYTRKWSLGCSLMSKEKYGTIRYEHLFPPGVSVRVGFQIVLPFFRKKSVYFDGGLPIILFDWSTCRITRLWRQWGWKMVLRGTRKAVEKWPHLEDEIMEDLAVNEWLVGQELHDKYWGPTCLRENRD